MKKINLTTKRQIYIAVAIILVLMSAVTAIRIKVSGEETAEAYSYSNVIEQVLADEVTAYLQNAADLGEETGANVANEAVESYRLIIRSDVDAVNDDHTSAIQERILSTLQKSTGEKELTEENMTALSAGVAEIVWQTVLSQIQKATENVEESDYFYLAESLQEQINELEQRKMKISVHADISNNTELTSEDILSMINGMTDQELKQMTESLGLAEEDIQELLESYQSDADKEMDSKLKEVEQKLMQEIRESRGQDGKNGEKGIQGEQGEKGEGGTNGKSIFVRYSENANGDGMTERPMSTSKYMGTYAGAKASTNPYDYSWSKYTGDDGKSIFIRYSEKSNGENMTERPTSTTKYMGTYTGSEASANPYDYSWSKYIGDDGNDGNNIFIRYSEKSNGEGMTEKPTSTTKYMGTYTGAKASADPSDYLWSQYVGNDGSDGNSVFIRYATSANGANMTKQPNSDTKYMGTYIGAKASADPEDYTWTRYSDATISFSNGTLYITQ